MAKLNSRRKGKRGENELAKILYGELGIEFKRNLDQTREGGCDLLGSDRIAIEVKRSKARGIQQAWWDQAVKQAKATGRVPVLAHRPDRGQWAFVVPMSTFIHTMDSSWMECMEYTATMGLQGFCLWYREQIL